MSEFIVGFSGPGCYCTTTHQSEQEANAEFDRHVNELRKNYASGNLRCLEERLELPPDAIAYRAVRFTPLLKSGAKGKRVFGVSISRK